MSRPDFFEGVDDESDTESNGLDQLSTISSIKTSVSSVATSSRSIWSPDPTPFYRPMPPPLHHHSRSSPFEPREISSDCAQLLIRDLDGFLTEEVIYADLSRIGRIVNFKLKQDKQMIARKFAYVTFVTPAEAKRACEHINSLDFLPNSRIPRRPKARMHEAPNQPMKPMMQPPMATVSRALILVGESDLPQLSIVKLLNESFIEPQRAVGLGKPVERQLCAYAQIDDDDIEWCLARVTKTDSMAAGFSDLEIVHPRRKTAKRVFNGQLFATNAKVEVVTLSRVEMSGTPDEVKFMIDKYLDNGVGFVKSQNGQAVQVYKTQDLSGVDLAASLEMFGMCKVLQPAPVLSEVGLTSVNGNGQPRFPLHSNDSGKKIYRIETPHLNTKYAVRVTHVGDDELFHVQIVSVDLHQVIQMEQALETKRDELRNHPRLKSGSLVITAFNSSLCRGITIGDRGPDEDYRIYYFDYGNHGRAPVASVDRPSAYWECSPQAIPCRLGSDLTEVERELCRVQLSCYQASQTIINNIEFIDGPAYPSQLRDYINSDNPAQFAYTVKTT